MTDFFTVLVISYFVGGEIMQTTVMYDREEHCHEAMNEDIAMPLYDHLFELYGNTIMMRCVVTEDVSYYPVRPKVRPNYNG